MVLLKIFWLGNVAGNFQFQSLCDIAGGSGGADYGNRQAIKLTLAPKLAQKLKTAFTGKRQV